MNTKKYFNFIAIFTLLLSMCVSLQSCKDDEDETLWGNLGEVVNIKYRETLTVFHLPTEDEDVLVVPGDIALLGAISDNDCVAFRNGELIANYMGTATVNFYRGTRDNVVKTITVNVVPNYEVTMKSGEIKSIAEIIGETPEGYVSVDNDRIANVIDGSIYAYLGGSTYIYVNGKAIGVTVSAYDGEALFSHPYMYSLASPDQIKAGMKAYTLSSETSQKIDGLNYIILTYAPFDNCKSISYFIRDTECQRLAYARIDTGKSSNDVFGWLLRDYSPYFVRNNILYFEQPSGTYSDWRVYPVDGKWSTLELKFP